MSEGGVIAMNSSSTSSTNPSNTTSTNNTNRDSGNKILQKRWVCDVCKVKWFLNLDEACAHEATCQGVPSSAEPSSVKEEDNENEKDDDNNMMDVETSLISNESNDTMSREGEDGEKGNEPSGSAPSGKGGKESVAKKTTNASNVNENKNKGAPTSKKQKKISSTEVLDVSEPEMDNNNNNDDFNGASSRRKSKRVRESASNTSKHSALKDCNASNSDTSTNKTNAKKMKKGKQSKLLPDKISSSKKVGSNKLQSSKMMNKGEVKGGKNSRGGTIASIFLPKKAASKKSSSKSSSAKDELPVGVSKAEYEEHLAAEKQAAQQKKKRPAEKMDDGKKTKKSQVTLGSKKVGKKSRKKQQEVLDINSSSSSESDSEDDSDDDVEYVAKSKKTNTNKSKKLKKNFLSQKDLADHQTAEIFAKRRAKRDEERERQKKRDEARLLRLNGKAGGKKVEQDGTTSLMRGQSKSDSTFTNEKREKCIPAVRFPCPSHIVSNDDTTDAESDLPESSSSLQVLRETPRYQHLKPDLSPPSTSRDEVAYHPDTVQDAVDDTTSFTFDLLSTVFDQCSSSSKKKDESDCDVNDNQVWVDRHSMTAIPDHILGSNNKDSSKKLMDFVEEWKVRRHKSVQSLGQVKRKKKRRKKKKSGYDSDDSFLDDGGLENVFLITGPTGSGKTRLVHAVAEQSECVVIEINSSEQRSGAALKRAIQETTQSHSSLAMSKKKKVGSEKAANNFFGGNGNGATVEDSDDDLEDSDSCFESDEESVKESHSLTIILIDEVDILFDEDTAFWPALAQVSQKAKCPIVLTATTVPDEVNNFRYKSIFLERPIPEECSIKMAEVARSEGMCFNNDIDLEEKLKRLSLIAEVCQCDMRKIINEMQLFHCTKSRQSSRHVKVDTNNFCLRLNNANCSSHSSTVVEDRPLVMNVEPNLVPKDRHSLITITGKGFASTSFSDQPNMVEPAILFIGGRECGHFRVVSDSKIIAVCPPCTIPKGVSAEAAYEVKGSENIDCLTCKFVEVSVSKRCSNGLLLDSSSHPESHRWNLEYDIQLRDDAWAEKTSRHDLIRKLNARKKVQKNNANENDGLMSSDEEEFDPTPDPPASSDDQNKLENDDVTMDDLPHEESVETSDVDPQALLDETLAEIGSCDEAEAPSKEAGPSTKVHPVPLCDVNHLADELSRLSDAILLEDSFSSLAIPSLSGSVEGFGFHAFDSFSKTDPSIDKLCKGKDKKPPSFEAIYSSGVNESGFFFGNSDSYVTYPNRKRDRQLLSLSELHSRGLGFLDINASPEENADNSKSGLNEDEESMSSFIQFQTRIRSEDDIVLNSYVSPTFLSLPSLLEQGLDVARKHGFTKDLSPLLQLRRSHVATSSLGIMHSVLASCDRLWYCGLRHDDDDEAVKKRHVWLGGLVLDDPLCTDYLPYLRSFAHHENVARQQVEQMMKENGDISRGGRKTRTSRKRNIRRHYLDECAKGQDTNIEAKALVLGQQLLC